MSDTSFALYRKYRPESFKDVRNQDHIVSVLEGAIKKGMIPHALLFTGSRGTGKTTVARIFAHAIGAKDLDIYEIDAASNRGIDDIRALKEAVYTLPYESPYKVYIIDEVHMLTKEAWNALLKTLEEPPAHVIFVLATTEKDKILDTIISRCQVFTFKSPTRDELTTLVMDVAKDEKLAITPAGASIIALAANGSYRDALSITQKVLMASGDSKLDADEISLIVGAPKAVLILDFLRALDAKKSDDALAVLERVRREQVDAPMFLSLVLLRVRAIMLLRHKVYTENDLAHFYDDERTVMVQSAENKETGINSALLQRLLLASDRMRFGDVPTLPLELAILESIT